MVARYILTAGGGGGIQLAGGTNLDMNGATLEDTSTGTVNFGGGANFNGNVSLGDNNLSGVVTINSDGGPSEWIHRYSR